MSKHEPLVTLRQIEDFARQAARLGAEGSRAHLGSDWKYQLAAERAVELMGEAANRLPVELRERHAGIPWREIIGMRNRLITATTVWTTTSSGMCSKPTRPGWPNVCPRSSPPSREKRTAPERTRFVLLEGV